MGPFVAGPVKMVGDSFDVVVGVGIEVLTTLPPHGVSDADFEAVRAEFSEQEVSDLSFVVVSINAWNRFGVGFRKTPGSLDAAYGLDKAGLS